MPFCFRNTIFVGHKGAPVFIHLSTLFQNHNILLEMHHSCVSACFPGLGMTTHKLSAATDYFDQMVVSALVRNDKCVFI
jgi:hypothetical protein